MNNIFKGILLAAVISFAATGKLIAQELNQGLSFVNFKFDASGKMNASAFATAYNMYTESGNDDLAKAKSDLKAKRMYLKSLKANNRASADFSRSFAGIKNAEWQTQKEAIVATYYENEVKNYVVYDKNGRWVRNMAYLFPDRIPEMLRKNITKAYPDFTINMVLEVTDQDVKFQLVYLENANMIKHVCVCNNEMQVTDQYRKAK